MLARFECKMVLRSVAWIISIKITHNPYSNSDNKLTLLWVKDECFLALIIGDCTLKKLLGAVFVMFV